MLPTIPGSGSPWPARLWHSSSPPAAAAALADTMNFKLLPRYSRATFKTCAAGDVHPARPPTRA